MGVQSESFFYLETQIEETMNSFDLLSQKKVKDVGAWFQSWQVNM